MDAFWAGALWALKSWLYLIISLIMFPAMFGFSLGISETYMTVLVKTLEVLLLVCLFSMVALSRRKTQMRASSAVGDSEDGEGESRRAIVENIFIQW